ncbi:MAG: hypothetical protein IT443_00330 [Phycisphaeraceae bacterium]|nr:hypothetical protein [Phycisphaeraceae bacterium]
MNTKRPPGSGPVDDKALLAKAIPIDQLESPPPQKKPTDHAEPLELAAVPTKEGDRPQIKHFGAAHKHADENWKRQPQVTGRGAMHMRTFFSKLRPDAIEYMDRQINEWLDSHPEYEVKFASSSVGLLQEKSAEPAIFVTVWV